MELISIIPEQTKIIEENMLHVSYHIQQIAEKELIVQQKREYNSETSGRQL